MIMARHQDKQSHWKSIECPFFHGDDATSINCEGVKKDSTLRQIFKTKQDKRTWEKKYCESVHTCKNCPVYKGANEKYK